MRRPRSLGADEAALWARVASTVRPLSPPPSGQVAANRADARGEPAEILSPARPAPRPLHRRSGVPSSPVGDDRKRTTLDRHGLDGTWERRLARGLISPDFILDLHGHGLDAAWRRLDHGLALALAQGARLVLVVTGRPRPVDPADRGTRRGAIRAKLLDWLAAGSHASKIAAVRTAHQRHGGAGAVYVVLKRT